MTRLLRKTNQLVMTTKVAFSKYSINILYVVKFTFKNVMYGKIEHREMDVAKSGLTSGMLRSRDQHGLETTFLVSVSVS